MDSTGWFELDGSFEYRLISMSVPCNSQDRLDYGAITNNTQTSQKFVFHSRYISYEGQEGACSLL